MLMVKEYYRDEFKDLWYDEEYEESNGKVIKRCKISGHKTPHSNIQMKIVKVMVVKIKNKQLSNFVFLFFSFVFATCINVILFK